MADHFGKQGRDGEDFEAFEGLRDGDAVGDDDFGESCALQAFDCGAGEDRMSGDGIHFFVGAPCAKFLCCGDDASRGIDHVVVEDASAAMHIAHCFHDFGFVMFAPGLMDDREIRPHDIRKNFGLLCPAGVGRDDDRVCDFLCLEVLGKDRAGIENIDGDREEALDLIGVEIEGDDVIRAGFFEEVGDEFGGDRLTRGGDTILTRIGEVREDDVNRLREAEFCRLAHEEEFYEGFVGILPCSLEKIDVLPADRFVEFYIALAATKPFDGDTAFFYPKSLREGVGEGRM